ncbi:alpha/beta hydrolase [Paenibacillus pini]|nr:alpha/beta hydrolase [Paenibacillus pini]
MYPTTGSTLIVLNHVGGITMQHSSSIEQLSTIKAFLKQTNNNIGKSVEELRNEMVQASAKLPKLPNVVFQKIEIGPINGEWVTAGDLVTEKEDEQQVILYFHGGGFFTGSCEIYRDLAARIAQSSGVRVLTLEYRLAPEFLYPTANEDCLFAYHWLLENGYSAHNIVFGGDSVGASLALMTLLSLRDADEVLPAGAFLISPHTDLVHLDGESYITRAELDPTGSLAYNQRIRNTYLGLGNKQLDEYPAILSPLRMDLRGLPSILIQVGDQEVLLSDAVRFTERARAAGAPVLLEVWEQMWSVFHLLAYMLPEAEQAINNIGQYVRTLLTRSQS